jgi:hypothetical protein
VTLAGAQSEADRIRRQLTVLTTRITRDRALARVQTSLAAIYSATGVDLVPASAEIKDLAELTREVGVAIAGWGAGRLPDVTLPNTGAPSTNSSKPE